MHFVTAKGILSSQNGMNLYRGCSHGCIYCDSRSRCYHMEHDFEDIEVKENAIETKIRNVWCRWRWPPVTRKCVERLNPMSVQLGNVSRCLKSCGMQAYPPSYGCLRFCPLSTIRRKTLRAFWNCVRRQEFTAWSTREGVNPAVYFVLCCNPFTTAITVSSCNSSKFLISSEIWLIFPGAGFLLSKNSCGVIWKYSQI